MYMYGGHGEILISTHLNYFLQGIEKGLSEQITYLTQVSTSQPHEGSIYGAEKVKMYTSLMITRPLNSNGATVRLTVSAVISRSHSGGLISHSLLSMSMTDLPVHTTRGFNKFSKR